MFGCLKNTQNMFDKEKLKKKSFFRVKYFYAYLTNIQTTENSK